MARINLGSSRKKRVYNKRVNDYYGCTAWRKLRASKMMEEPLCEECMRHGRVAVAEEVHHVRRILSGKNRDERMKLLLDYNNLRSLCIKCHKAYHRKMVKEGMDYCLELSDKEYNEAHYLDVES